MKTHLKLLLIAAAAFAAVGPPGALADTGVALTVPSGATTGTPLSIGVASSYDDGANGSELLTVFLVPPTGGPCPARAVAPAGAKVVLAREPADQVLIVNALSGALAVPGTWTACAYLTLGGVVTAAASQPLAVSGPAIANAGAAPSGHQKAKHHKAKHHKAKHHHKPS